MTENRHDRHGTTVSSLKWSNAAEILAWFEVNAMLEQISDYQINSFRVTKTGFTGLVLRKKRTLERLNENLRRIEIFVDQNRGSFTDDHMVIIRSSYVTVKRCAELVQEHIATAKRLQAIHTINAEKSIHVEF